ncbi:MAG: hypothetical protein CK429_31370 [Mycobacterium sp.]|nr:MAG: hypothetical protein CK429_31370 [Mycobacterium sp.]
MRRRHVDHRWVRTAVAAWVRLATGRLDDGAVAATGRGRRAAGSRATACDDGSLPGREGRPVVTWGDTAAGTGAGAAASTSRSGTSSAAPADAATRTSGPDTTSAAPADAAAEGGAFLPEDVAVPAGVGAAVCPWPGGDAAGCSGGGGRSGGHGAATRSGSGNTAGTGLRSGAGTGRPRDPDRLRGGVPGQRRVSAAADAQPSATGGSGLATYAHAAHRTCDVRGGSTVERRAFTGDQSRLASYAGAQRGVAAGDAAGSGRMSTQSRLAGETGLAGDTGLADETRLTCHPGLTRKARLARHPGLARETRLANQARLRTCSGACLTAGRDPSLGADSSADLAAGADTAT